jgi:hypothetical protein
MYEGFSAAHPFQVAAEVGVALCFVFLPDGETEQRPLGPHGQRLAVQVMDIQGNVECVGKMILKRLELVFADQLQPGCGRTAFAAHKPDLLFRHEVFILFSYFTIFFSPGKRLYLPFLYYRIN